MSSRLLGDLTPRDFLRRYWQKRPLLIRGARQVLTLRGPASPRRGLELRELTIIPDGAVLVCEGVIAEVGPTRRLESLKAAQSGGIITAPP